MMKKLIFLLILAVILGGFVSAQGAAHPPGTLALDVAMPGYGDYEAAVTPDTVSADMLLIEQTAGYLALPELYMIDVPAGQPQHYPLIKPLVTGQGLFIPPSMAGFHLRL